MKFGDWQIGRIKVEGDGKMKVRSKENGSMDVWLGEW